MRITFIILALILGLVIGIPIGVVYKDTYKYCLSTRPISKQATYAHWIRADSIYRIDTVIIVKYE